MNSLLSCFFIDFWSSNACKFTPSGGKVTIRTRLVLPSASPHSNEEEKEPTPNPQSPRNSLTLQNVDQHNHEVASDTIQDRIVVRVEVSDTGSGIRPQDMVQSKLFCEYNSFTLFDFTDSYSSCV